MPFHFLIESAIFDEFVSRHLERSVFVRRVNKIFIGKLTPSDERVGRKLRTLVIGDLKKFQKVSRDDYSRIEYLPNGNRFFVKEIGDRALGRCPLRTAHYTPVTSATS